MKIALATLNSKYIHPSLALRILKKDLANHGIKADLKEYTIKTDPELIINELNEYDYVCWSTAIYNIEEIKAINKHLTPFIIMGGPEVSYLSYEDALALDFDLVICGEGEKVLVDYFLNKDISAYTISKVDGLKMNKTVHVANLDYVQPLTNDFSDIDTVNQLVYLETSRGCPYLCGYCQASLDNNVRNFPIDYVLSLIEEALNKKVKIVKFLDRTFNFDVTRTNQIIKYIIDHDNGYTTFQLEITGELIDQSTIDLIRNEARFGLFRFEIGIQSTNKKANQSMRRYQDFTKLSQTIKQLEDIVILHLDLIAGLPYEDLTSFKKTFNEVFALQPPELQLGFLKLLKGTYVNEIKVEHEYIFETTAPFEIISNKYLSIEDLNIISIVNIGLEQIYNHNKAKALFWHLLNKYRYDAFTLFYNFGLLIKDTKQRYDMFMKIMNSNLIQDEEDLIVLLNEYYGLNKQKDKILRPVKDKKRVLHALIKETGLIQNEVFNQARVEELSENSYFIYLVQDRKSYIWKER